MNGHQVHFFWKQATRATIIFKVSSIRTPTLIQGRLERTETNLRHFKWEGDLNARKPT